MVRKRCTIRTMSTYLRMSVNINKECADILREVKARHGISATEAVRRAIGLLGFTEQARHNGEQLYVESRNGRTRARVEIL